MKKMPVVFGIFRSKAEAERAVEGLRREAFPFGDLSLVMPHPGAHIHPDASVHSPAQTAASTGALIGGTLGLLAGIGAFAIPGVGPFVAAGPLMSGLAGLGVGVAIGGLNGALIGIGMPELEAKRFESFVFEGGALLSVHTHSMEERDRAESILRRSGALEVSHGLDDGNHPSSTDSSGLPGGVPIFESRPATGKIPTSRPAILSEISTAAPGLTGQSISEFDKRDGDRAIDSHLR